MINIENIAKALEHATTSWKDIQRDENNGVVHSSYRKGMQRGYAVIIADMTGKSVSTIELELENEVDQEAAE